MSVQPQASFAVAAGAAAHRERAASAPRLSPLPAVGPTRTHERIR
jgi:hypothetical protein